MLQVEGDLGCECVDVVKEGEEVGCLCDAWTMGVADVAVGDVEIIDCRCCGIGYGFDCEDGD